MSGWGWGVMGLRERGDIQNRKAGQVHWEEMWTDGTVSIEREREKDREATVISRVAALVNVAMSTFRSDTGADGQFAPVSALAVLPHECSAGALQQPSNRTRLDMSDIRLRRGVATLRHRPSTLTSTTLVDGNDGLESRGMFIDRVWT